MKRFINIAIIMLGMLIIVLAINPIRKSQVHVKKDSELRVLSLWVSSELLYKEDLKKPSGEWLISQVCEEFEKQYSDVKIELTVIQNPSVAHGVFQTVASAESGPDIVNLWTGQYLFALKDVLLDLTSFISPSDQEQLMGWDSVTLDFTAKNPILGFPIVGSDVCGFIYNKEILKNAGIDLEQNAPKNPNEFMEMLKIIQESGYLPIVADDLSFNSIYTKSFASWWVQMDGSERPIKNSFGESKFAEDTYFLESFKKVNEIYELGYINENYAESQDAFIRFVSGEAAFFGGVGTYVVTNVIEEMGSDKIGFYTIPDFSDKAIIKETTIGGTGQALSVNRFTPYPKLAVEFCSFLCNKENQLKFLKAYPQIPIRKDISIKELGWVGDPMMEYIYYIGNRSMYWVDNSMQTQVTNEFFDLGKLVVTGVITPEEMANALDEKVIEVSYK